MIILCSSNKHTHKWEVPIIHVSQWQCCWLWRLALIVQARYLQQSDLGVISTASTLLCSLAAHNDTDQLLGCRNIFGNRHFSSVWIRLYGRAAQRKAIQQYLCRHTYSKYILAILHNVHSYFPTHALFLPESHVSLSALQHELKAQEAQIIDREYPAVLFHWWHDMQAFALQSSEQLLHNAWHC
jgi:hypothetical protein